MASTEDMEAILDQALDDLEKVETTAVSADQDSAATGPVETEQPTHTSAAPSSKATKTQRNEAKGVTPADPEEFFRYLIEGDDEEELEEENRDAELDQFMKQMKEKFQEQTRSSSTKQPNDTQVDDDVAATLASILEQMATIDQDDPFLQSAAGDFKPDDIVDGMMQQLLSKDLMYEPMKQVADQFPAWLEENEGTLPATDLERYKKQFHCFQALVNQYETDASDIDTLMKLMQEVQEFGQPPQAIIEAIAPGLELDADGIPKLNPFDAMSGFPDEECTIMWYQGMVAWI